MSLEALLGLTGKNALVVGGGQGMGKASAGLLMEAGANVAILDIDGDRAAATAKALTAEHGTAAVPVIGNIMERDQLALAVGEAAGKLGGKLDVLVHIVGAAVWKPLADMSDDEFELDLARNMKYVVRSASAFSKLADQNPSGRAIVNIASIAGITAAVDHAAYGAAKAALIALTKTMAVEWGPLGIRVNTIAPGTIATDGHTISADLRAFRSSAIPLRRVGEQEDIGKAVLFLASNLSSYVTGQTLTVDGGILCRTPLPGVEIANAGAKS